MKVHMLISLLFILSTFTFSSAFAASCYSQKRCQPAKYVYYKPTCAPTPCQREISECDCTDPACYRDNPCLSKSKCCAAFGNIGAR